MNSDPNGPSRVLELLESGDGSASAELMPLVYEQLRALAEKYLTSQREDHTLQPTALVHEAWLKLVGDRDRGRDWNGRQHFVRTAAQAMRQILIDYARERHAAKRGGNWRKVTLSELTDRPRSSEIEIQDLAAALEELETFNTRVCRVAELRLLGGLSCADIGKVLELGLSTVEGDWTMAKAYLRRSLSEMR